ncbi:MAG: hypothetical protein JKX91_14585 [Rhizobiaceae bacterium]|nr:hypothetical protein [Rhizobiaceae bacterium]
MSKTCQKNVEDTPFEQTSFFMLAMANMKKTVVENYRDCLLSNYIPPSKITW